MRSGGSSGNCQGRAALLQTKPSPWRVCCVQHWPVPRAPPPPSSHPRGWAVWWVLPSQPFLQHTQVGARVEPPAQVIHGGHCGHPRQHPRPAMSSEPCSLLPKDPCDAEVPKNVFSDWLRWAWGCCRKCEERLTGGDGDAEWKEVELPREPGMLTGAELCSRLPPARKGQGRC